MSNHERESYNPVCALIEVLRAEHDRLHANLPEDSQVTAYATLSDGQEFKLLSVYPYDPDFIALTVIRDGEPAIIITRYTSFNRCVISIEKTKTNQRRQSLGFYSVPPPPEEHPES